MVVGQVSPSPVVKIVNIETAALCLPSSAKKSCILYKKRSAPTVSIDNVGILIESNSAFIEHHCVNKGKCIEKVTKGEEYGSSMLTKIVNLKASDFDMRMKQVADPGGSSRAYLRSSAMPSSSKVATGPRLK